MVNPLVGQGEFSAVAAEIAVVKHRLRLRRQAYRAKQGAGFFPHLAANLKQVGKIGGKAKAQLKLDRCGAVVGQGEFFKQSPLQHQVSLNANGFGPNSVAPPIAHDVGVGTQRRQGKPLLSGAAEQ